MLASPVRLPFASGGLPAILGGGRTARFPQDFAGVLIGSMPAFRQPPNSSPEEWIPAGSERSRARTELMWIGRKTAADQTGLIRDNFLC